MVGIGEIEAVLVTAMMVCLGLTLLAIALRKRLVRLLEWMDRRGWIRYRADPHVPTYGTLANSLNSLQAIGDPRQQYVLEAKLEDRAEQDDEGGPDKPGRATTPRLGRTRPHRRAR
jgi:hypothetical protein